MKFISVEQMDDFSDEVNFWIALSDLPQSIQDEAKRIDGEEYNAGCFGTCVCLDTEKKEYRFAPDDDNDTNVYYVKDNGDKAWFRVEMDEALVTEIFSACADEYSKQKTTVLDDYSVADCEDEDEYEI